jgi:DNA repair protein RadA
MINMARKKEAEEISETSEESEEVLEDIKISELENVPASENFKLEDISGIGAATIKKLKDAGYIDAMGIATSNPTTLAEICEIGEPTAQKIIQAVRSKLKMDFVTGMDFLEKMKNVKKITTSSKALDALIGGGVESQAITEAYGAYGSGKSQLAFQLAVNVQLPEEQGGLNAQVVWVDTEATFRPSRIIQLAKAKGLDPEKTLQNIRVARAFSADHQILLVEKIPELFAQGFNIKLVIIDSLTSIFRSEYVGRGTLAERQQKLNKHIHDLQRLADRYNIAIYVTNQVMSRPDIFFGDPTTAVGGHILGHASTYRLYLRHSKGEKRVARLVDSPSMPEGEAAFNITEGGISDIES